MSLSAKDKFIKSIQTYKKNFLVKKYETLDESATRIMVNHFLSEVLGFAQLDEIKTEYQIKGTYADYVIQIERKKYFIVEVKSIQTDLSEQHLRQATGYAANEGIEWILLTNGRQFDLYKVIFNKPIQSKRIFSIDLNNASSLKDVDSFYLISRKSLVNKEIDKYWAKFQALQPTNLAKLLYSQEVIRFLKKALKTKSGINFDDEDIIDSVYQVIVEKIPSQKPKSNVNKVDSKKKVDQKPIEETEESKPKLNTNLANI